MFCVHMNIFRWTAAAANENFNKNINSKSEWNKIEEKKQQTSDWKPK